MRLIAIDPGSTHSAWATYEWYTGRHWAGGNLLSYPSHGKDKNGLMMHLLRSFIINHEGKTDFRIIIEEVCFGARAGKSLAETARWSGRFEEACLSTGIKPHSPIFLPRWKVCSVLLGSPFGKKEPDGKRKTKDSQIRTAIIDALGAPGTASSPGATYGYKADEWQALALCLAWAKMQQEGK